MAKVVIANTDSPKDSRTPINNNFTELYTGANVVAATEKTTPVDADKFPIQNSADSNLLYWYSWANLKATLKTWILGDSQMMSDSIFRQAIINGNFDVWQRGTSIAMTAANAYTADRWYAETATAGTDKTVSQQDGTGVEGSVLCARVAMVQDVDELLTFSQALETQDSKKFRGKKLTLSFYARGGAEFVADNPTLVCKIKTGKGTDQKVLAFTTSADAISANETLTTSWVKFTSTTTAVIASDITQIGVSFAFTHAGSGTTTNYFELTQVQLCAGDVALPFQAKSYEEELGKCHRFFARLGNLSGVCIGSGMSSNATTASWIYIKYPRTMRSVPTNPAYSNLVFSDFSDYDCAVTSMGAGEFGLDSARVTVGFSGGGATAFRPGGLKPTVGGGYFDITAEF